MVSNEKRQIRSGTHLTADADAARPQTSHAHVVAAALGPSDLRISNEKSQIGVATRLDAERDALRPSSLLGGMHLPSGYAAVKMRTSIAVSVRAGGVSPVSVYSQIWLRRTLSSDGMSCCCLVQSPSDADAMGMCLGRLISTLASASCALIAHASM